MNQYLLSKLPDDNTITRIDNMASMYSNSILSHYSSLFSSRLHSYNNTDQSYTNIPNSLHISLVASTIQGVTGIVSEVEMWEAASSFETATQFAGAESRESLFPSFDDDRFPFWWELRESRREGVPLEPPFARGPTTFFELRGLAGLALEVKAASGSELIWSWYFFWSCKVPKRETRQLSLVKWFIYK